MLLWWVYLEIFGKRNFYDSECFRRKCFTSISPRIPNSGNLSYKKSILFYKGNNDFQWYAIPKSSWLSPLRISWKWKIHGSECFRRKCFAPTISLIQNREILVTRNPKFSECVSTQSGSFTSSMNQLQWNSIPNNSSRKASESVLQVFSINHQYESTIACYRFSRHVSETLTI